MKKTEESWHAEKQARRWSQMGWRLPHLVGCKPFPRAIFLAASFVFMWLMAMD